MRRFYGVAAIIGLLISLPLNLIQHAEIRRLHRHVAALEAMPGPRENSRNTSVARGAFGAGRAAGQPRGSAGVPAEQMPSGTSAVPEAADTAARQTPAAAGVEEPPPAADRAAPVRQVFSRPSSGQFSPEQIQALTNSIALYPNGVRVVSGTGPEAVREVDPLAANLIHGFGLLGQGSKADAATVFESILAACPLWPYGLYYLSLATGKRSHMEEAAELLHYLETIGRATPETRLYRALAGLFLDDPEALKEWLAVYDAEGASPPQMMLGPLYVPRNPPSATLRRLEAVSWLPLLHKSDAVR